jgi:hypothetical protein
MMSSNLTIGIDVFVNGKLTDSFPSEVKGFVLDGVFSRGTKVTPQTQAQILDVGWLTLRYLASEPVTDQQIFSLLQDLPKGLKWTGLQKLHVMDEIKSFS